MSDGKAFNLLDEPWIGVVGQDTKTKELSLIDVFRQAHEVKGLCNELPTLDFAILRLLLAVLHAIFARSDMDGMPSELITQEGAQERWGSIWQNERFPDELIAKYLTAWRERFYLIHQERPFYQVPDLDKATEYNTPKLIGDISQSSNKLRLFSGRENRAAISYSEAARWLLYLNAFDDTSSKPKGKAADGSKLPSPGVGYPGKLGMVVVEGNNLFETLMLNLILTNEQGTPFPSGAPMWELDTVRREERVSIPLPESMAALLTIQSRRILLEVKGNEVLGYRLLGGDFFVTDNAFIEQMTLWREDKTAKQPLYKPRRHNAEKQFWRDFSALVSGQEGRRPGVLSWISSLQYDRIIDSFQMNIAIAGIEYGDKDFFVDGIISDSISVNSGVLFDLGERWIPEIINALELTDYAVGALGELASDIALAMGDDNEKGRIVAIRKPVRENAYFELDARFRNWIEGLRPNQDIQDAINRWKGIARKQLLELGKKLVSDASERAFVGRYRNINNKEVLYCTSRAYQWFLWGKGKKKIGLMGLLTLPSAEPKNADAKSNDEDKKEETNERK